jgi:hypothetical protein
MFCARPAIPIGLFRRTVSILATTSQLPYSSEHFVMRNARSPIIPGPRDARYGAAVAVPETNAEIFDAGNTHPHFEYQDINSSSHPVSKSDLESFPAPSSLIPLASPALFHGAADRHHKFWNQRYVSRAPETQTYL